MKNKTLLVLSVFVSGPLMVGATPATDRKIEYTSKQSYNYRTFLEDHIKVKAEEGIVTLTGIVQSEADKELATATVENIPGVTAVNNEIVVKPAYREHSDAWIAFKIRGRLLSKANVSFIATKVAVKDGVATLTGTAENLAQKELTGTYAKGIDGVKSVENEIVIKPRPAADLTLGEKIDDVSITSQIKYALISYQSTSALNTKVTTTDGVVVITGEAASDAEKSLVSKLAQDVRGVKSVTNNMTVTE